MTRQERIQQKRIQSIEVQIARHKLFLEMGKLDEEFVRLGQEICSLEIASFDDEANELRKQVRKVGQ